MAAAGDVHHLSVARPRRHPCWCHQRGPTVLMVLASRCSPRLVPVNTAFCNPDDPYAAIADGCATGFAVDAWSYRSPVARCAWACRCDERLLPAACCRTLRTCWRLGSLTSFAFLTRCFGSLAALVLFPDEGGPPRRAQCWNAEHRPSDRPSTGGERARRQRRACATSPTNSSAAGAPSGSVSGGPLGRSGGEGGRLTVLPRLIATDLDGTLLDPMGAVAPSIRRWRRRPRPTPGILVVFATGRPPIVAGTWSPPLGAACTTAMANGTVICTLPARRCCTRSRSPPRQHGPRRPHCGHTTPASASHSPPTPASPPSPASTSACPCSTAATPPCPTCDRA